MLTDRVSFYIFYHDEKSFSLINRDGMPDNFNLIDLRTLPIPKEFRISELTLRENRDIFSESLTLLQLKPDSDMVGLFPYSIPLKFSEDWAKKTSYYDIFLPPVKFSDFYGKSFDTTKLYVVEFADFWNRKNKLEVGIKKHIDKIHQNPDFRVGEKKNGKNPFKNSIIVKTEVFLEFQKWLRKVTRYFMDKYGWDIIDMGELNKSYNATSFHSYLGFSQKQKLIDTTLRHRLSALSERLFAYYFGQIFKDEDKIDLRFFKGSER